MGHPVSPSNKKSTFLHTRGSPLNTTTWLLVSPACPATPWRDLGHPAHHHWPSCVCQSPCRHLHAAASQLSTTAPLPAEPVYVAQPLCACLHRQSLSTSLQTELSTLSIILSISFFKWTFFLFLVFSLSSCSVYCLYSLFSISLLCFVSLFSMCHFMHLRSGNISSPWITMAESAPGTHITFINESTVLPNFTGTSDESIHNFIEYLLLLLLLTLLLV